MSKIPALLLSAGMVYLVSNVIRSSEYSIASMAKRDFDEAYKAQEISLRSTNETVAQAWETYQSKLAGVPTLWDIGRLGATSAACIFSGWKLGSLMAKLAGNYGGANQQQQYWIGKIGAIFTGAITWYITRSAGLTFVNTVVCLYTDHNARDSGVVAGSAIVGTAVSAGYLVYTFLAAIRSKDIAINTIK